MGGLRPDEGTACSYPQKKDPPVWTMPYSHTSPRVLMCWLHLQRKDQQRGPYLTARLTLAYFRVGGISREGPAVWTMLYSEANPCILMNWLHIPSKAHHHSPGPTARLTLAYLWLTAIPMKGPPAGPYSPHSYTDPCVLKGNCISEEKPTSVDKALQPPACSWWSASPKKSTSVVQGLNPC